MTHEQIDYILDTLDQSVDDDLSPDHIITLSTLVYDNLFKLAVNETELDIVLSNSLDLNNILLRYLLKIVRRLL